MNAEILNVQISISRDTKCVDKYSYPRPGHIHRRWAGDGIGGEGG